MAKETVVPHGFTDETLVGDLPAVSDGQEFWLFHEPSLDIQRDGLESRLSELNGDEVGVSPLGNEGQLIWDRLVSDLAILIAPPQQTAVFVVPVELIQNSAHKTIWEALAASDLQFKRFKAIESNIDPTVISFPEFTPRGASIPSWLRKRCDQIHLEDVQSSPDAIAIKAGLFQIHGDLHTSHEYSQDCQGEGRNVAGDYWHGIMHRREPDYGNSKYWFRRVGQHPVFGELAQHADAVLIDSPSSAAGEWRRRLTSNGWNPNSFVDLAEECALGRDGELASAARKIQFIEMILLLEQTYKDAIA